MGEHKHTLGIIGTGTMGQGLAQVAAQAGYEVLFQNRRQECDRGLGHPKPRPARLEAKLTETEW